MDLKHPTLRSGCFRDLEVVRRELLDCLAEPLVAHVHPAEPCRHVAVCPLRASIDDLEVDSRPRLQLLEGGLLRHGEGAAALGGEGQRSNLHTLSIGGSGASTTGRKNALALHSEASTIGSNLSSVP